MHDSTRLAKKGIPTVTIAWDTFEVPARTQARLFGTPDVPLVIIPHFEPGETDDTLRRRAEETLDEVLTWLTSDRPPAKKRSP